jgi:hypothetical protein
MVEVFKTNVKDPGHAKRLIEQIHQNFSDYKANFDLEDCDNILRVQSTTGFVQSSFLIALLEEFGYTAEVLPDDNQVVFHADQIVTPLFSNKS